MTLLERLMAMVERIRAVNDEGKRTSFPQSETIYRKTLNDLVENEEKMRYYLRMLAEAHYIFIIRLVEPDDRLLIHGLETYVVADIPILMKLKEVAYSELELAYEGQYYKRKQATQVVREMIGTARQFNNTPLGKSLNLAMMLQQFEQFMATRFVEFSDTWKGEKLRELIPEILKEVQPVRDSSQPSASPRRAVDSEYLTKIEEMDRTGKWGEAVQKFGVEFLVRVHLRKYEFARVKQLIKQHKIATEKDLRFIRDSLRVMESRFEQDPELKNHAEALVDLRRLAQLRMNQIVLARKEAGLS